MKYYKIKEQYLTKDVGNYPQIQRLVANDSAPFIRETFKLEKYRDSEIPEDYKIDFPLFKLAHKVKLTDILTSSYSIIYSIVVSDKFVNFIESLNMPKYQLFKIEIQSKEIVIKNYQYLKFSEHAISYINFDKTILFNGMKSINLEGVKFKNHEEYINRENINKDYVYLTISGGDIILKKEIPFDLFTFGYYSSGYYVSEKFKTHYERLGLKGIEFDEVDFPILP